MSEHPASKTDLITQWRNLRDKLLRGDEDQETLGEILETGDLLVRALNAVETDGYSQAYADQMRTALLRIGQEIAVEEVDPDDCRESIKRLVYEALMPPRSAVEPFGKHPGAGDEA